MIDRFAFPMCLLGCHLDMVTKTPMTSTGLGDVTVCMSDIATCFPSSRRGHGWTTIWISGYLPLQGMRTSSNIGDSVPTAPCLTSHQEVGLDSTVVMRCAQQCSTMTVFLGHPLISALSR